MGRTFLGYKRPDGRIGVRNHVLILPASVCASDTTRIISNQVNGTVTFNNQLGCSQVGIDLDYYMETVSGFAANPNIYATIVVALGCENAQADLVVEKINSKTNKPIRKFVIQEEGGTLDTIAKVSRAAQKFVAEADLLQREEFPISELILGTNCGGSDPTSGLASNPVVGNVSDKLVKEGGTSVLCETTEFIGAEHILARRASSKKVHDQIYDIVYRFEKKIKQETGMDVRDGNPSPGNKDGGLSTLEEKSLGCIHKGGESPINAVYDYSKELEAHKGLVIMDTPGNDASSVAGIIAGGCQLVVFTTGRGTPTGNAVAPVIKITANRETYKAMSDNIDFDASPVIYDGETVDESGEKLLDEIIEVANGKMTKAEALGYTETAIQRMAIFV